MQEAGVVHLLQAIQQRRQHGLDLVRRQPPLTTQPMLQRLAAQQLHDDVGGAVGLEEIEHPHDTRRVVQGGHGAALPDEALTAPGEIVGHPGRARQHHGAAFPHRQG